MGLSFISARGRHRQIDLCDFKACLVNVVSSRIARDMYRNPASKTKLTNKQKKKNPPTIALLTSGPTYMCTCMQQTWINIYIHHEKKIKTVSYSHPLCSLHRIGPKDSNQTRIGVQLTQ